MTIKLNSLARWNTLAAGQAIVFESPSNDGERRIRLHLNVSHPTALYAEDESGPRFLCVVPTGVETVEFFAAGKIAVFNEDGDCEVHYQTAESEPTFAEVIDPVIFTKIANRRHRNPELEEVMYRMQLNMERRLAQQAGEIEAAFERRRKEETDGRPAETVISNAPGAAANASEPAVQSQEPASEQPLESAGTGEGGGEPAGT